MKGSILLFFCLVYSSIQAQQTPLPKYMTEKEKGEMADYYRTVIKQNSGRNLLELDHPRAPAEWEEMEGIVIAWEEYYGDIQAEIVRHAVKEGKVYIISENPSRTSTFLINKGVEITDQIEIIEGSYDSLWIRDYGPNSVYLNDVDSLIYVDWIYNRPRYDDDKVPTLLGNHLDRNVVVLDQEPFDLVHTGGNFMTNGLGQGFSSKLVLDENDDPKEYNKSVHSREEIEKILADYMGIEEYILMETLPYDAIHHIDMHMKIVNEQTIIVGEYPEGVADGPQIKANIQYVLDQFRNSYGEPYEIIWVPMPPDRNGNYPDQNGDYRTYANALIINKTVLLPTYDTPVDDEAIAIWQSVLPGHKIVGINCNNIIFLNGALHCITKELAAQNPIWIRHQPLKEIADESSSWDINCTIKAKEEIASAEVVYKINDSESYETVPLELSSEGNYFADLTSETLGVDSIYYFIAAEVEGGKRITFPLTGYEGGGFKVRIEGSVDVNDDDYASKIGDVYPNPASTITAIPIDLPSSQIISVVLYDIKGNRVETIHSGMYQAHKSHCFFDASKYASGQYVVQIEIGNRIYSRKVIIQ